MKLGDFSRAKPIVEKIKLFESDVRKMRFYMDLIQQEIKSNEENEENPHLTKEYKYILYRYSCSSIFSRNLNGGELG